MSSVPQTIPFAEAEAAIVSRVRSLLLAKERVILAIDGNCCAGKTTLANRLNELLQANVFHLDDYFLQPQMRTPERLRQPGGNVDAERFLEEVLSPAARGETAHVQKYDCHENRLLPQVTFAPNQIVIVEGAYSMHPLLAPLYDFKVFLRVAPALQSARILSRNGATALKMFQKRWIPLENEYFQAFEILSHCDIVIDAQ